MLGVAREAWESAGYQVQGPALSGIASENLESGSGIASCAIASLEHQWSRDRELLTRDHVLVIDEAGMIGSRQMERIIAEAQKRSAKVVLVGDPEQLQAIETGAAFRSVAERHGSVEIGDIRRQREDWQRDATRHIATGRTGAALSAYEGRGHVHVAETREQSRADLIERWDRDRAAVPTASRIILTHTKGEVQSYNEAARQRLRIAGQLGEYVAVHAERGSRTFAPGDRIMFLKNERGMGVRNGSLGVVQSVTSARMAVMLDDARNVAFDLLCRAIAIASTFITAVTASLVSRSWCGRYRASAARTWRLITCRISRRGVRSGASAARRKGEADPESRPVRRARSPAGPADAQRRVDRFESCRAAVRPRDRRHHANVQGWLYRDAPPADRL